MTLALDPEMAAAMAPIVDAMADLEPLEVGDWQGRRTRLDAFFAVAGAAVEPAPQVRWEDFSAVAPDGVDVALRWYRTAGPTTHDPGPAVVYLHGGGMILGSVELYQPWVLRYVADSGVPALAVEYRLAPEHPHPVPVEDCYAGVAWLADHAQELGVDPGRVAVMGDSAGGGLAAAVAFLRRARGGTALARQILVYPMLDDRTTAPDPEVAPFATWTYADNATGWRALLGAAAGTDAVPPAAAPARATDLAGLPPAYIEVGDLDIFRAEDVAYAARLAAAGVPVELHVHAGVPHGFEIFGPACAVTARAHADRVRVLRSL